MTTAADAAPVSIVASDAPAASAEQLLGRVHAKLSTVESSVAAALHEMKQIGERILSRVEQVAARAAAPVGAAAAAIAAAAPPPISTVAKAVAALCACGHDALHTAGGCTAPGCTCQEPPAKK